MISQSLILIFASLLSLPALAEPMSCQPAQRQPANVELRKDVELSPILLELHPQRRPATYIPRTDEFRQDLRRLEGRMRGVQQDILDFMEQRAELQRALQNFRRLYPNNPLPAEEELAAFYELMNNAFTFFSGNLNPDPTACRQLVEGIENSYLRTRQTGGPVRPEDVLLTIRLIEKMCRLR